MYKRQILKFSHQDEVEERAQKQLYDSATRDGLTNCYNKKYFADQLKTEFAYFFRHSQPLSVEMCIRDRVVPLSTCGRCCAICRTTPSL